MLKVLIHLLNPIIGCIFVSLNLTVMDINTRKLVQVSIQLAAGVVLKHIQNEMIIVDKDGNIIEGAKHIQKPNAKNIGEEMLEAFKESGVFDETPEEKMYHEAVKIVNDWLKP
jgi:hypothetical protein